MKGRTGGRKDSGSNLMRGASILKVRAADRNPDMAKAEEMKKQAAVIEEEVPSTASSDQWDGGTAMGSENEFPASEHEEDYFHMEYFSSATMASILEDTLAALKIFDSINNELRITECNVHMQSLLAKKYGVAKPQAGAEALESIKPPNINSEEVKIKKFMSDRAMLISFLTKVYSELALDGKFQYLTNEVKTRENELDRNNKLLEEEAKNKLELRDLRKQIRFQRNSFKSHIIDVNTKLENIFFEIQDVNVMHEISDRYVQNWQNSRCEQNNQRIKEKEANASEIIDNYKLMYDREQRAHIETESIFNVLIEDALTEIEKWMDKYETDIENIDLAIQIKRNDYENKVTDRIYLEKKYEQRTLDMERWIKFKEDREKKRQYDLKMLKSALIVQAWWRGLMVRLAIGPYRPKKKKGKRNKTIKIE